MIIYYRNICKELDKVNGTIKFQAHTQGEMSKSLCVRIKFKLYNNSKIFLIVTFYTVFTQCKIPNAFLHTAFKGTSKLVKKLKKMLQEHGFTSFFPKSPPGFMVAKIRNFCPAVNSSTSLSLSSRLPFSANTRDFSTSRTLKNRIIGEHKIRKGYIFLFYGLQCSLKRKKVISAELSL